MNEELRVFIAWLLGTKAELEIFQMIQDAEERINEGDLSPALEGILEEFIFEAQEHLTR